MNVLEGVRVLDLGSFITAPYAAMLLAELGADTIKVERGEGDPFRAFRSGQYSGHFQAHNRNKRSVVLDYARPEGREVLLKLVETADVVVINSRPGVPERIGVGCDALRERNPRLVYCAITGFGATGPYAERAAFDNVGQALSGWMSRFRTGDDPRVAGPAISDAATGLFAAIGILGALHERTRTGVGRKVEVSMLEATVALAAEPLAQFLSTRETIPVFQRAAMSPAYTVTCKDGARIGLHLSSPDKFWERLCEAIGRPDLRERYPRRLDRVAGYDTLAAELDATFRTKARAEWVPALERADVPFAPELQLEDLEHDPQVRHLGVFYDSVHPVYGTVRAPHRPIRIDGERASGLRPPPDLGEHTDEILSGLGIDPEGRDRLRTAGIIPTAGAAQARG